MSNLNQVNLIGRVGGDPEVRTLPSGDAVANLSIATSEKWKDKQTGEQKEATEWHKVVFFGKLAEIVGEYVRKGALLYVGGSLRTRKYEKDGVTHYATEIKAADMRMLGSKSDSQGGGQQNQPAQRPHNASAARPVAPVQPDAFDDDIPF
jgi:single-strand DNA-binding protein